MNFLTTCFRECWNPTSQANLSDPSLALPHLARTCSHISNEKDFICEKCFYQVFIYDRFIIRQLFVYLNPDQRNFISMKEFEFFAQKIFNWHEYINHIDFLLQLFHILLARNFNPNSIYQLMTDAFFFTAIQTNVSTNLTSASQIFLQRFVQYFAQLNENENENYKIYFNLIKRILPWGFISIHKWLKICFLSNNSPLPFSNEITEEWNSDLSLTFLWYITNWLASNKVFRNEYDPLIIFEKVSQQEFIRNLYDSDQHGYSIVTLCQSINHLDGPFLLMFDCNDGKLFAILLEGKLLDSAKPYGGRSSLCVQLSPQFLILERGPSILYWNIKKRADGPLAIRIGHNGITRVSLDVNMEYIHHPEGTSRIIRVQIYKFGPYKTPLSTPVLRRKSHHNEYNLFSVDAHKLAESIGIHLFT